MTKIVTLDAQIAFAEADLARAKQLARYTHEDDRAKRGVTGPDINARVAVLSSLERLQAFHALAALGRDVPLDFLTRLRTVGEIEFTLARLEATCG